LFRIDRNYVHLGATRLVQVDSDEGMAGAVGESLYAAASATYLSQAQLQAQELLAEARAYAEKIKQEARDTAATVMVEARDQAEEDRRRAWQEGYTEGAEEGKRAFDGQLAAKKHEDDEMLQRVISEVYSERERTFDTLEDDIVTLALDIVRKVIKPADEAIGGVFEPLVRNALKQMAPVEKVIIRISPVEYERFFSAGSAVFTLESGTKVTASFLRDASLNEGDCIIDAAEETVNAGLDSQLKYVKLMFEKCKYRD